MWRELLRDQVKARGLGPVALDLDYSKAAISLVLRDKYDSSTERIEAAVNKAFGTIRCPFEERDLSAADCRFWRTCDRPTTSPWSLNHWSACRTCSHNPTPPEPR